MGRKIAVGIRSANSVLPKIEPDNRSRKYQPAGNGAPSVFNACHQLP